MTITSERLIPEFSQGDRIRKAVEFSGHSVQAVADYLGVNRNTLSAWMHDRNRPRLADLRVIAEFTGVDLDWLTTGRSELTGGYPFPVTPVGNLVHMAA